MPANGTLFVMNRNQLYALQEGAAAQEKPTAQGFDRRTARVARRLCAAASRICRTAGPRGDRSVGRHVAAVSRRAAPHRDVSRQRAPAPKLAWAWEGGEVIDSSPAIVEDVVYAGTATGELIAVGLSDGKL